MAEEQTLFDRIGGAEAVERTVDAFYQKVLGDDELKPFFSSTPMEKLQRMQYEFFAAALDGPTRYTGRPLNEAHQGRGIEARHLQRFLDHLIDTLHLQDIPEAELMEVISRINTYANEITGGGVDTG